ncbi:peptidoglycan-binding protein [Maricaulis sp.]|uniref:peptidoglycan-binding domain-containing protein n=1 Tax=Maricaulis sp. TaxID=1486257 RepID=UPI003A8E201D
MSYRFKLLAATIVSGTLLAGAAAPAFAQSSADMARELANANARIRDLENQINSSADYPPALADGQCFARVLVPVSTQPVTEQVLIQAEATQTVVIPATYETVTDTVLLEPERVELRIIPATYTTVYDTVVVEPERVTRRIIPATYRTVTETVVLEPERVERQVMPVGRQTVTETVVLQAERIEQVVIPAVYESYTEQVLVRDAYTTWHPSAPLYARARDAGAARADETPEEYARRNFSRSELRELPTGEILCRVEIPAEYETITRQRLVQAERVEQRVIPAVTELVEKSVYESTIPGAPGTGTGTREDAYSRVVERVIPAVTETVTRQVIDTPEQVVEDVIPAVTRQVARQVVDTPEQVVEDVIPARYESVRVQRVAVPGRTETRTVPAVYETRTRQVVVGGGNLDWREVLCEINATPEAIRQIQIALRDRGYNPGPIDGVINERTFSALERYQTDNNLIVGQITRESVEHLGVPYAPLTVNLYSPGVE